MKCAVTLVVLAVVIPVTGAIAVDGAKRIERPAPVDCIPAHEQNDFGLTPEMTQNAETASSMVTQFADPMGGGGMFSPGLYINNYVDRIAVGIRDYMCGGVTYDGHGGTDVDIIDFYEMDEGVAVLAAASGVVTFRADGNFDRCLAGCCGNANRVFIQHADGSIAWYYHLRSGSVRVSVGQAINVGDTIGMVGSSGCSTWPHLHFEVRNGASVVDPWNGTCNANPSWWIAQEPYITSHPFALFSHVLSKRETPFEGFTERWPSATHVTAPGYIESWIGVRNFLIGDTLKWQVWRNGGLWTSSQIIADDMYTNAIWIQAWGLPTGASNYGNWEVRLFRNSSVIDQKFFTYNAVANQQPVAHDSAYSIPNGYSASVVKSQFGCTDPDGSPFWYVIQDGPSNGTLVQDGGRRRKFTYTPNPGFSGVDTILYYAIDDDSVAGPLGEYVVLVQPDWYPDDDNDGYGRTAEGVRAVTAPSGHVAQWGDCDDNNASVNPGATEICDGLDNDCDFLVDVDAPNKPTWYLDSDGDGYGATGNSATQCNPPVGYVATPGDCDDNNSSVHPSAVEICDGLDNDCNTLIDDNAIPTNWFADDDEDGFGDLSDAVSNCGPVAGRVSDSSDCDDSDPAIHPGADEFCNGLDNDCDGTAGDNAVDAPTWYRDIDGDGFGTPFVTVTQCNQPVGYVASFSDCNDNNSAINPGAPEVCDGVDNDCNGTTDINAVDAPTWYVDSDNDGYGENSVTFVGCNQPIGFAGASGDCDDANEFVNPGTAELCGNFTDDNCDGNADEGCCECNCHTDPVCDAVINDVQDVVATINVGFRGAAAIVDPNSACPRETTDLNCDGVTTVIDIVKVVNVAFRGANTATEYCDPCP